VGIERVSLVALLFAHHGVSSGAGEPYAAIRAAGISVIERQARQVRRAGATRIVVIAERMPPGLAEALERVGDTEVIRDPATLNLTASEQVLVLEEGLIVDERAIRALTGSPAPALAVWSGPEPRPGAERLDAVTHWAGLALYDGSLVASVAGQLGEWDLQSTLLRAAVEAGAARVDLGALPTYEPNRRRDVPLIWLPVRDAASAVRATDLLLAAAQKGCLDWPAHHIHPPVENALVRLLLDTPITPNTITVATGVLGFLATAAFANGWLWTGLLLALVIGPLDGVDGKLARTRMEFSRWGDLEHVLDKFVEYSWFLALAYHFSGSRDPSGPWALAAIITLFALAEAVQGEFFNRVTGAQLDDAGPFERRFRTIAGRRNTFMWTLLPFALFGAWYAGFVVLAAYSALTFFVTQARFFYRLQAYARAHAPQIEANMRRSAYTFLSRSDASAN
jgi:phosphatidylglycerophosphate synthase